MNKDAPKMFFLRRILSNKDVTQGVFMDEHRSYFLTLELPWKGNEPFKSCIPVGFYTIKRGLYKPKHGDPYESYYLENVRGRTGIWFHVGNIVDDTDGCILTGSYFGVYEGKPAVLHSRIAHELFMESLKEYNELMLLITENS